MGESLVSDQLREQLRRFAISRGVLHQDADDLAGQAWLKTAIWAERETPSSDEIPPYAFRALKSLLIDFWSSPQRVLSKRLNHALSQTTGEDPLSQWERGGQQLVGKASHRNIEPLSESEEIETEEKLSEFLYSDKGLGGANPSGLSTRKLVQVLLQWTGRPMRRQFLISVLAAIVVVPTADVSFDESYDSAVPPVEPSDLGRRLFDCLRELTFRMRAAVLLELDLDHLQFIFDGPPRLSEVLEEWCPPPRLEEVDLPIPDDLIASKIGIEKGYLQVIRCRAKKILASKLGLFEPQMGEVYA